MSENQTKSRKSVVRNSNKRTSKYERDFVIPILIKELKKYHIGKENSITSCQLGEFLNEMGYECVDARIRAMIKFIQLNGLCKFIISSSCGFYYSRRKTDVLEMIENFKKREDELRYLRKNLMAQLS